MGPSEDTVAFATIHTHSALRPFLRRWVTRARGVRVPPRCSGAPWFVATPGPATTTSAEEQPFSATPAEVAGVLSPTREEATGAATAPRGTAKKARPDDGIAPSAAIVFGVSARRATIGAPASGLVEASGTRSK